MNKILRGDCLSVLKTLESESVDCCITSPPYWRLRDYGVDGQLGLEKTPEEYVDKMIEVFREVRRILKRKGTLFLNLGDTYATTKVVNTNGDFSGKNKGKLLSEMQFKKEIPNGLKSKDLVGIPWRVAFALQNDGWYLRQDIIWHKPNPMPESVTDRCTKAHEYVFLMSKSPKYYFDSNAIKEDCVCLERYKSRLRDPNYTQKRLTDKSGKSSAINMATLDKHREKILNDPRRNKRSVWTIPTHGFKQAHFATFPTALIEPMIKAGCPQGGVCLDPFFGSGTVGVMAKSLGRNYIGIEINPKYVEMADARLNNTMGCLV